MAHVIFLRAANVGGNNVFGPKQFCLDHPELQLANIGHAGTFVCKFKGSQADIADAVGAALPIDVPMAIIPQEELQAFVANPPAVQDGAKAEVTVLFDDPPAVVLPMEFPPGDWEARLLRVEGRLALTERKPGHKAKPPYKGLDKPLGVPGTTRSWNILVKAAQA